MINDFIIFWIVSKKLAKFVISSLLLTTLLPSGLKKFFFSRNFFLVRNSFDILASQRKLYWKIFFHPKKEFFFFYFIKVAARSHRHTHKQRIFWRKKNLYFLKFLSYCRLFFRVSDSGFGAVSNVVWLQHEEGNFADVMGSTRNISSYMVDEKFLPLGMRRQREEGKLTKNFWGMRMWKIGKGKQKFSFWDNEKYFFLYVVVLENGMNRGRMEIFKVLCGKQLGFVSRLLICFLSAVFSIFWKSFEILWIIELFWVILIKVWI